MIRALLSPADLSAPFFLSSLIQFSDDDFFSD